MNVFASELKIGETQNRLRHINIQAQAARSSKNVSFSFHTVISFQNDGGAKIGSDHQINTGLQIADVGSLGKMKTGVGSSFAPPLASTPFQRVWYVVRVLWRWRGRRVFG